MRGSERKFFKNIIHHCYQNTIQGNLIFYSVLDHLVFFTLFCISAKKHHVQVLAHCQMPDHLHDSLKATQLEDITGLVRDYSRIFVPEHQATCHTTGPLFNPGFGSAPKVGDKAARTNLVYVGNNAPERRLCKHAEDYQWNFLAYARSDHPFSDKLIVRKASWHLKKAMMEVNAQHNGGKHLSYNQLKRMFASLDGREKKQLTDYIVTSYNVIDHQAAINFFGSYENMLSAMHTNTGSEYDLNEIFVGRDDTCFNRISNCLMDKLHLGDIHDVFLLSESQRRNLIPMLQWKTRASEKQIAKYLRLP